MNPIKLLAETVDNLWSVTVTIMVVALILLLIRTINLQRRVDRLEQRLVHAERDYNLTINNWNRK